MIPRDSNPRQQRSVNANDATVQAISFFLLAFLITWGCHLPQVAFVKGWISFRPPAWLLFAGVFGPMFAAILLTYQFEGRKGVKRLFSKFLIWKVAWYWFALALFTAIAVRLTGLQVLLSFSDPVPDVTYLAPAAVIMALPQWVLIVPIEEIGWRGFALPRLQAKYSALGAGSILGVLWGIWHLPLMLIQPSRMLGGSFMAGVILFLLSVFITSLFMTWLFNSTRGSLLIATLFHAASNAGFGIFSLPEAYQVAHTIIALLLAFWIIGWVLWRKGAENMSGAKRISWPEY